VNSLKILLSLALLALIGCIEEKEEPKLRGVKNYVCYYGQGRLQDLAKFDLVIIQPGNYTEDDVEFLKKMGTLVIGYVSIGEDSSLRVGDGSGPGGYASWYLDYFLGEGFERLGKDNLPDKRANWMSYFVNPSDPAWQYHIIHEVSAKVVLELGCNGLFLDTVDYPYRYPTDVKECLLKPGLINLIKCLRTAYSREILIVNGTKFLQELEPYIDGIMLESFSATEKRHSKGLLMEKRHLAEMVNRIRNYPKGATLTVFTLDYVSPCDIELIEFVYKRAKKFGFIPTISVWGEEDPGLYMVNPYNDLRVRENAGYVEISWDASIQAIEDAQVDHLVIKKSRVPICSEDDWEQAVSVGENISPLVVSFLDPNPMDGYRFYALRAVKTGGYPLVGTIKATLVREEEG
jgi:endo-alpha-1,4-polygalactosaminidase (GH114 family)